MNDAAKTSGFKALGVSKTQFEPPEFGGATRYRKRDRGTPTRRESAGMQRN